MAWPKFEKGIKIVKAIVIIESPSKISEGRVPFRKKPRVLPTKIKTISVKILKINQLVCKSEDFNSW